MASLPITEEEIRGLALETSFARGEDYFRRGAVLEVIRRGNALYARVQGSEEEPYRIWIELGAQGVQEAMCTCPYDGGGICKHRVAVLLTVLRTPEAVEERPPVEERLAALGKKELRALWRRRLREEPWLVEWLEVQPEFRDPDSEGKGRGSRISRPMP